MPETVKICPKCGAIFTARHGNMKYCSIKCAKSWKPKKPIRKLTCLNCGTEFETRRSNQKYCSWMCCDEYYEKHIRNRDEIIVMVKRCENCGKPFTTTNKLKKFCTKDCYYEHNRNAIRKKRNEISKS